MYPSMHWATGCVYPSMHWTGGCLPRVCVSSQRGVCLGDVYLGWCLLGECLPRLGSLPHIPPLWTQWQMPAKILPCHNYVVDGNKQVCCVWDTWERENLPVVCRMLTYPRVIYIKTTKQWNKNHWKKFFQDAFVSPENLSKQALYFSRLSRKDVLLNLT